MAYEQLSLGAAFAGQTFFAVWTNAVGQAYDGSTFVTSTPTALIAGAVSATADDGGNVVFGDPPALVGAGAYTALAYFQSGANPATSDLDYPPIGESDQPLPSFPAAPPGPVSVALAAMQQLLANMAYFLTWTGAANPSEALTSIFLGEVGYQVTSAAIADGVLTITTREPHTLTAGQQVTLQGASIGAQSPADLDGTYTVEAVTSSGFTAAVEGGDLAVIYPQGAFVLPSAEPFAVISEEQGRWGARVIGTGGASVFSGALEILFEAAVASQYANDPVNALGQARSELGQLVQAIAQTQGTGDFICLNSVEVLSAPQFIGSGQQDDNTTRFDRWQSLVKVTWGLDS